jgi:hypothetical protein
MPYKRLTILCAALATLSGCSGGGGDSAAPASQAAQSENGSVAVSRVITNLREAASADDGKIRLNNNTFYLVSNAGQGGLSQSAGTGSEEVSVPARESADQPQFVANDVTGTFDPSQPMSFLLYLHGQNSDGSHPGPGAIDVSVSYQSGESGSAVCTVSYRNVQYIPYNQIDIVDDLPMHVDTYDSSSPGITMQFSKGCPAEGQLSDLVHGTVRLSVRSVAQEGLIRVNAKPEELSVSQMQIPYRINGGPRIDISDKPKRPMVFPASVKCQDGDGRCASPSAERSIAAAMSNEQMQASLRDGITVFRLGDAAHHGSCAACHSPDGYDIARLGYSDADIARRAQAHIPADRVETLVNYIHALRKKYNLADQMLNPDKFRPFQPAGAVLAVADEKSATPEARDLAFANSLRNLMVDGQKFLPANDVIDSAEKAAFAAKQTKDIDLRNLPIGLPLNRWGEDLVVLDREGMGSHPGEGDIRVGPHGIRGSLGKWLPFMGTQAKPGFDAAWYTLQDAYIHAPTDYNLWKMIDGLDRYTQSLEPASNSYTHDRAYQFMLAKFKASLIAQHMLRQNTDELPDRLVDQSNKNPVANRNLLVKRNPIWEAGERMRRWPAFLDPGGQTTFPGYVAATYPTDDGQRYEMNEIFKRTWFWASLINDPALLNADETFRATNGDYFYASLKSHYKVHYGFVMTKVSVEKATADPAWRTASGRLLAGHGMWASRAPFLVMKNAEYGAEPELLPEGDPRAAVNNLLLGNLMRMWIYQVNAELDNTHAAYGKDTVFDFLRYALLWLRTIDTRENHTERFAQMQRLVCIDIRGKLDASKELSLPGDLYVKTKDIFPEILNRLASNPDVCGPVPLPLNASLHAQAGPLQP